MSLNTDAALFSVLQHLETGIEETFCPSVFWYWPEIFAATSHYPNEFASRIVAAETFIGGSQSDPDPIRSYSLRTA